MTKVRALLGGCGDPACAHVWPVVYLPMPLELAAEIMGAARCPMCGGKDVMTGGASDA